MKLTSDTIKNYDVWQKLDIIRELAIKRERTRN